MEVRNKTKVSKPKALVFYTYLPPWRIDVFNEMGEYYDLTIFFLNAKCFGFTYNKDLLLSKLKVNAVFVNKGFMIGSRAFRFGIYRIIQKYKPTVVFTHEYSPTSILLASYLKLHLFRFKLIITTSDNLSISSSVKGLKKYSRSYVLNSAHGIVVYSENVKQWYQSHFSSLRVKVCPNIQNPQSLLIYKAKFTYIINTYIDRFQLHKPIILYVGRLEKLKGLDLLIKAYSKSLKDTHLLVLVGEGSQKEALISLAKKHQVVNNVIFPGYFDDINLYAWYTIAHFFVLPSRYEPFGAVVNEALVLGCPVLASKNIGALDYIEEGVNGYIFNPENLEEFKQTLLNSRNTFPSASVARENLMKCSFEHYVKAFKTVVD